MSPTRYCYSHTKLHSFRHARRSALPENINNTLHLPNSDIPTLKPRSPIPFTDLSLPAELLTSLKSLSLTTASPIQATAIPYARLGGDLVAQATSGTGKTLTYALASLESITPGSAKCALVIVPARELASQVADVFTKLSNVRVITLVGGTKESLDEEHLSKPANVIVGTPGRVEVMITRGCLDVSSIKILVLDEADRLLDGSFGGAVERICNMLPTRQTLAFSATYSYAFRLSLLEVMRQPSWIGGSEVVHSVEQRKHCCDDLTEKIGTLKRVLSRVEFNLCVVFSNAKKAAARMVRELTKVISNQIRLIHAGMPQRERDAVIDNIRNGKVKVLVTTDVLARGIDFDSCDLVFQMDVPQRAETYLHRVGRAGRFGRKGFSVLLFDQSEISDTRTLEDDLGYKIEDPVSHTADRRSKQLPAVTSDIADASESLSREVGRCQNKADLENDEQGQTCTNDITQKANEAGLVRSTRPLIRPIHKFAKIPSPDSPSLSNIFDSSTTSSDAPRDINNGGLRDSDPVCSPELEERPAQVVGNHLESESNEQIAHVKSSSKELSHADISAGEALLSIPTKRPRFPEELATPAKKQRSARLALEDLPLPVRESGKYVGTETEAVTRPPVIDRDTGTTTKERPRAKLVQLAKGSHQEGVHAAPRVKEVSNSQNSADKEKERENASSAHGRENIVMSQAVKQRRGSFQHTHPSSSLESEKENDRTLRKEHHSTDSGCEASMEVSGRPSETTQAHRDVSRQQENNSAHLELRSRTGLGSQPQAAVRPWNEGRPKEHITDDPASARHDNMPIESISQECREAWDKYAAVAYETGYREAYEEAFRIARQLRQRLEGGRS